MNWNWQFWNFLCINIHIVSLELILFWVMWINIICVVRIWIKVIQATVLKWQGNLPISLYQFVLLKTGISVILTYKQDTTCIFTYMHFVWVIRAVRKINHKNKIIFSIDNNNFATHTNNPFWFFVSIFCTTFSQNFKWWVEQEHSKISHRQK